MISNDTLARAPLSRMLMALLLVVQLLCVFASTFAAGHSGDDIHHQTLWSDTAVVAEQPALTDPSFHTSCDHCSHCHAAHTGLFKHASALPLVLNEQPVTWPSHIPISPNRSIYRPPIA